MKGDVKIIGYLNKLLGNELVAISQYFLHARMFKNQGPMRLDDIEYHESIDEMKHADKHIERILFLGGTPSLQDLDKLGIGRDVEEMLQLDLRLELEGVRNLRETIAYADGVHDYVNRDMMIEILADEEGHIDWLETELDLTGKTGLQDYLQLRTKVSDQPALATRTKNLLPSEMVQMAAGHPFSIFCCRCTWWTVPISPTSCQRAMTLPASAAAAFVSHARPQGQRDILYRHSLIPHDHGPCGIANKGRQTRDSRLVLPRQPRWADATSDRDKKASRSIAGDR